MKKYIILLLSVCIVFLWLSVSVRADTPNNKYTTLVNLLEQNKKFNNTNEAYLYRSNRSAILDVAIQNRPNNTALQHIYDLIQDRKIAASEKGIADTKEAFADAVNTIRRNYKLWSLEYNDILNYVAQSYAIQMDKHNNFSHIWIHGDAIPERIAQVNYPYLLIGENLAKWYKSIDPVFEWWMASPTHKANILDEWFVHMWLGRSGEYWVHLFGKPQ